MSDQAGEHRPAGGDLSGHDLMERIADIAQRLAEAETLDETLQRIVDLAEEHLEHCDGVSMMLIRKGRTVSTPAYSSEVAHRSDMAQYETGEGPCLQAIIDHETIVIDDLEQEERWPAYAEKALELGVRSMISFRLFVAGDTMGALDLYSSEPHAYDDHSRVIGQVFASHAAVAIKAAITEAGLESALESRDVIGQAKGIIMEREKRSAGEAFDRLRELSSHHNRKLRELAAEIAETGEIPER